VTRYLARVAWLTSLLPLLVSPVQAQSTQGAGGDMPAYYDARLFTINFAELSSTAEKQTLAHNSGLNRIFMSDPGLPGGEMFVSVLDAIQADGFNPLWQEYQIMFTAGNTPVQLYSDTQIDSAAAAGEITVTPTGEVYRCSVVGPGPQIEKSAALSGRSSGVTSTSLFPNPFNPEAKLSFMTTRTGALRVSIYDLRGRLARRLVDIAEAPAGLHEIRIDGKGTNGEKLASGVYFYRIETESGGLTGRFTILK